jgi:hypothetical protein
MWVQCVKNYYQNVLLSEHTVTGHSDYNFLTAHHSVTLITWQLYIMKLTGARQYNFLVQPCSNITICWFIYRVCNGISGLHSHKLQDCWFFTVAVLLPPLLYYYHPFCIITTSAVFLPPLHVLKTISCKFNQYLHAVYCSKLFVLELFVSSVHPRYFLCPCAFVQPYLLWKSSKYYIFRYYVCIQVIQHATRMRHIVI